MGWIPQVVAIWTRNPWGFWKIHQQLDDFPRIWWHWTVCFSMNSPWKYPPSIIIHPSSNHMNISSTRWIIHINPWFLPMDHLIFWVIKKKTHFWIPSWSLHSPDLGLLVTLVTILTEVISMLVDPNLNSPANIDAAVNMKNDYDAWKKKAPTEPPEGQPEGIYLDGIFWWVHIMIFMNIFMRLNDEWDSKIDNDEEWDNNGIFWWNILMDIDIPSSVVNRWLGHPLSAKKPRLVFQPGLTPRETSWLCFNTVKNRLYNGTLSCNSWQHFFFLNRFCERYHDFSPYVPVKWQYGYYPLVN